MRLAAADRDRSAVLVDPRRAAGMIRELPAFAGGALELGRCEILHARYRTSPDDRGAGKAFLSVCYRITVHDPARGTSGDQVLHLKAYPPGRSRGKFEHARRRRCVAPRFGAPVVHLPALDAVVWAFPNDPKLPHLSDVVDPEAVKRHLPCARLPPGFRRVEDVSGVRVDVVRYKPEVRCTTRYELRGGGTTRDTFVLYGKTFGHGRAAEVARRMDLLWRLSEAGDRRFFRVARPLGWSDAVKTVWQEALPGTPVAPDADAGASRELLRQAAAGLARFHRAVLPGLTEGTVRDDLDGVRNEVAEIAEAFPSHGRELAALVSQLERALPTLEAAPAGLVHGDFLLKQLVRHEGRLGLCDFDNLATGDPLRDVANFIVDLHFQGEAASRADEKAATFLDAYAAESAPLPPRRLEWQRRLHCLRAAFYLYKRRQAMPGFEEELARILRLAHPRGRHA